MKERMKRILSIALCTLLLFSGMRIRNVEEHIHFGEGTHHEADGAVYEHEKAYFDPLAAFVGVFDYVLSAVVTRAIELLS